MEWSREVKTELTALLRSDQTGGIWQAREHTQQTISPPQILHLQMLQTFWQSGLINTIATNEKLQGGTFPGKDLEAEC